MESKLYKNMEDFHFGSIIKYYIESGIGEKSK
jgi:hypothetical protein